MNRRNGSHKPADPGRVLGFEGHLEPHPRTPLRPHRRPHRGRLDAELGGARARIVNNLKRLSVCRIHRSFHHRLGPHSPPETTGTAGATRPLAAVILPEQQGRKPSVGRDDGAGVPAGLLGVGSAADPALGSTDSHAEVPGGGPEEDDGVAGDELLLVDEVAPPGGQQVPPRCPAVYVAEPPYLAVDVLGDDDLNRGIRRVVQPREDGFRAVARHGEAAAIVGVGLGECLGEGGRLFVGAATITTRVGRR